MKLVIAGGGTGGHLYPGIAIAREVLKDSGSRVLFVGTEQGIEAKVLPKENLPVRFIKVGKLKGMKFGAVLRTLGSLPVSIVHAARILRDEQADVVIGIGGYASGPVALAAWVLGIPLLIVEPNSYAGLANRVIGRIADRIILPFPGTDRQHFFSVKKVFVTGPLVRKGIERGHRAASLKNLGLDQEKFTVFVMGGSGGAHAINMALKAAAPALKDMQGLQILHQTGEKDVAEVAAAYREAGVRGVVLPYIHDMAGAYAAADLVICRSGATTVAELAVCGKHAVLIPFPFAADNHQEYNARTLAAIGSADVIVQKDLTPGLVAGLVRKYAGSRNTAAAAQPNTAAEEIAGICRDYVQKD